MFIKYEFVKGTKVAVEVDDKYGLELEVFQSHENNLLRRDERRGNESYDQMLAKGKQYSDDYNLEDHAAVRLELERLRAALAILRPQQRELLHRVFFEGKTLADIAREDGVSKAAVSKRLKKTINSLKKKL